MMHLLISDKGWGKGSQRRNKAVWTTLLRSRDHILLRIPDSSTGSQCSTRSSPCPSDFCLLDSVELHNNLLADILLADNHPVAGIRLADSFAEEEALPAARLEDSLAVHSLLHRVLVARSLAAPDCTLPPDCNSSSCRCCSASAFSLELAARTILSHVQNNQHQSRLKERPAN
jgi:hypothetical protein